MHKSIASIHGMKEDLPAELKHKLVSVIEHVEKFGSVNDLTLCKIFGETIWNDGVDYHSHALSFRINQKTGCFQISQLRTH
ncbi:hypothetical protein BCU68_04605 [Vibrio sp. 10N.286.49.B3]|uniref:hypothetical protein n=1 Tax=Vibrio sp. 10N.286.49.B3 TaxID=1880855 RepID=UPI000C82DACB|nr:hypothetical protein [Vibrio sp. 10N.286.49.B3]PMH43270.1 hypothetical protein BCU68_04605 [Vibrio sp. 10N.286.49.B3]